MKKLLLSAAALCCFVSAQAQWSTPTTPSSTTGPIYYLGGNVGINSSSPNAPLQFANDLRSRKIVLYEDANNNHQFYGFGIDNSSLRFQIPDFQRAFRFYSGNSSTSSTEIFTIEGGGKVGIGTATPLSRLHIVGPEVRIQDPNRGRLQFFDNAGGNLGYSVRTAAGGGWAWQFVDGNNKVYFHVDHAKESVGIGTENTGNYKLNVWGRARAHEVVVNTDGADFVFANDYRLRPLREVEQFIATNQHLPEIPSAQEMQQNGMAVGELQTKLLQKVEELTLYVIEQNKKIDALEQKLKHSKKQKQ